MLYQLTTSFPYLMYSRYKFRKYEVVGPASGEVVKPANVKPASDEVVGPASVKPASDEVVGPASEPISDHDIVLDGTLDHLLGGGNPESDGDFDESLLETIARNSTSASDGNTFFQPLGGNNSLPVTNGNSFFQPLGGNNSLPVTDGGTFFQPLGGNNSLPVTDGNAFFQPLGGNNSLPVSDGGTFFQPLGGNNSFPLIDHDYLITMVDELLTLISDGSDEANSATGRMAKKRQFAEV
jgi:hypothetical protein